jgi:hypothetical protein
VPARLGFVREVPESGLIETIYSTLFAVDMPHIMVPSLHVVFSTLILLALANASAGEQNKILWYGWLMVICASTLLVHQHHLIDVVAGLALAFALRRIIVKREEI